VIDSHCHLNLNQFEDDLEDVLARALGDGVSAFVNIGFDRETARQTAELMERYPFFYGVFGVHPHDAESFDESVLADIQRYLDHPRALAVGEIGLDFYRDHSPRDVQREVFRRMIALSRERAMPIVIHCRDAFDEVVETLRAEGSSYRGIFHAFAGTPAEAEQVLDLGLHIGVGGVATFRNSQLSKTLPELPPERIVLETDSPYLTPHPYRGRRNEPGYLIHVARAVAEALGQSQLEVAHTTTENLTAALAIPEDLRPSGVYRLDDAIYIQTTSGTVDLDAVGETEDIDEAIICGFGEPLDRLDVVLDAARWAAEKGMVVRVNTTGLGNVIAGRDVTRELSEFVDEVVVVFYGTTASQHERMAKAGVDEEQFEAMRDFVRKSAEAGMDAVCEFVAAPKFKADPCREFARELGAQYDIRMYRS
jgi:TatD DNase family protein